MVGRSVDDCARPSRGARRRAHGGAARPRRSPAAPLRRDVSFEVRAGEIVGIAGLIGAGRTEICEAVFGAAPRRTGGRVRLAGRDYAPRGPGRHGDRRRHAAGGPQERRAVPRHERRRQRRRDAWRRTLGSGPRAEAVAASGSGRAPHRDAEHGAGGRQALGRQPAEGAARQDAGDRARGADRSTSRRAASTSAPRPRSTGCCASSRREGVGDGRRLVRPARGARRWATGCW